MKVIRVFGVGFVIVSLPLIVLGSDAQARQISKARGCREVVTVKHPDLKGPSRKAEWDKCMADADAYNNAFATSLPSAERLALAGAVVSPADAGTRHHGGGPGREHPPTEWRYGQQFSQTWRTNGDVCTSISRHPEQIYEIRITEQAKHGVSGKNGQYGIAYKPTPCFQGTDSFSYVVISNSTFRDGAGLVATVNITVMVE